NFCRAGVTHGDVCAERLRYKNSGRPSQVSRTGIYATPGLITVRARVAAMANLPRSVDEIYRIQP
ncbi:MAG: hypothetical protein OEW08_12130, partial [Gammaproteobacteria bacterium]|nr:hypothetical protein [Gammaproteobacteria bacterium]